MKDAITLRLLEIDWFFLYTDIYEQGLPNMLAKWKFSLSRDQNYEKLKRAINYDPQCIFWLCFTYRYISKTTSPFSLRNGNFHLPKLSRGQNSKCKENSLYFLIYIVTELPPMTVYRIPASRRVGRLGFDALSWGATLKQWFWLTSTL